MSYIEARTMTYSLDQPYLEMPWDSSPSLWLMKQGRKKSAFSEVYGKPWSLSPSNAVCAVHGWCNALISQNTWCQSITHSNRHFGLSTPQWQLLLSTSGFLTRNFGLNPTIELLKMAPISRPRFPQSNKMFSEDITSAILNGASVSSTLHSQG